LSMTILRETMDKARAILSVDADADKRYSISDSVTSLKIRSVMCAPLVAQSGGAVGAIQIDSLDNSLAFSKDDLDVLASVAAQAALSLESARLHSAAMRQHDDDSSLAFATQLQMGFVPNKLPQVAGYEFFDFYESAHRVGGDFFDYVLLPDGGVAVTVGDVAGKGVPAALLMAHLCSDARSQLLTKPSPAEALFSLHQSVVSSGPGNPFATMLLAVLAPETHSLTLVNAGHLPPLLRRADGAVEQVGAEACGLPLGVATDVPFVEETITIAPHELLVLYSDGLTEAMNATNEIYGLPRLSQVVSSQGNTAQTAIKAVVADIDSFCGATPPRDDIFIVAFQRVADADTGIG
jgi:sigma-B regulation protein RsbU (phosphoserine phosphatase)